MMEVFGLPLKGGLVEFLGLCLGSPSGLYFRWADSLLKYNEKIPKATIIDPKITIYKVASSIIIPYYCLISLTVRNWQQRRRS